MGIFENEQLWLNGYGFWRKQYTARNLRYNQMLIDGEDTGQEFPFGGVLKRSETIIDAIIKGPFPLFSDMDKMTGDHYSGVAHSYLGPVIELLESVPAGVEECTLKIDCSAPVTAILAQVARVVEGVKKRSNKDYVSFLPHIEVRLTKFELEGRAGVAYEPVSDPSRAIGIWIFDYIEKTECSQREAARVIGEQTFMKRLVGDRTDEEAWRRMYRRTKACVEAADVLKIQ